MPLITLSNEVHNTTARVRIHAGETLTAHRLRDIKRRLCGVDGCQCSGADGTRGRQHWLDAYGLQIRPSMSDQTQAVVERRW